jgi:hypothetical protein
MYILIHICIYIYHFHNPFDHCYHYYKGTVLIATSNRPPSGIIIVYDLYITTDLTPYQCMIN